MTRRPSPAALRAQLEEIAERVIRLAVDASTPDIRGDTVLDRIRNLIHGFPRAQRWDGTALTSGESWCWSHEQPLGRCIASGRDTMACSPETIEVQDPTGEIATSRSDDHDFAVVVDQLDVLASATMDIEEVFARYPAPRPPTVDEIAAAASEGIEDDEGCQSCARVGVWEPMRVRSTIGGALDAPMRLCRWCQDVTRATGRIPTRQALVARHGQGRDNPRVRR